MDSGDTDITTYTWDYRNRLTTVTSRDTEGGDATQTVSYTYDASNRMVSRSLDADGAGTGVAITSYYVYDGTQVALEFDGSDLSHRYLWGQAVDELLADEQVSNLNTPGDVLWPLTDNQGTVRDLATYDSQNDVTTIANHRTYGAYGQMQSESNSAVDCVFGYTGRMLDEATGLQNNLNRWYDAGTGRWLSEDPAKADPNLYRYVGNNPILYVDPTGLWKIDRANGAKATATSEKGDTIGSLASKIGLYVVKYPQWLTTPKSIRYVTSGGASSVDDTEFNSDTRKWGNTKLCPDQKFEIPNRIMCLWYGDVGETGQSWAFDPYVQQFKKLGFDVDTFYDRDKQSILNAAESRTKEKYLQGIFVVGHGSPVSFGTGNGWFDSNPQQVTIRYDELAPKLAYKLGVVVLWVCYGGGSGGRSLSSQSGECVFDGVDRTLVPYYDYTSLSTLFANGKQGTKSP